MKGTRKRLLSWLLAIAMIVGTLQTNVVTAYAETSYELGDYVTSATLTDKEGGTLGETIQYGSEVTAKLAFEFSNDFVSSLAEDNKFTYTLPFEFKPEQNQPVMCAGTEVGTMNVSGTSLTITFDAAKMKELLSTQNNVTGSIELGAVLTSEYGVQNVNASKTWKFKTKNGDTEIKTTVTPETGLYGLTITKETTDWDTNSMTNRGFKLKVTAKGINTDVKVTDTLGTNLELANTDSGVHGFTVKKNGTVITEGVTVTPNDKAYTIGLPDTVDGDVYEITYAVNILEGALGGKNEVHSWEALTEAGNKFKVAYKVDDNDKSTEEKEVNITVDKTWVSKTGEYDADDNVITWTVKLNASGAKSDLRGAKIKENDADWTNMEYIEDSLSISGGLPSFTWEQFTSSDGVTLNADSALDGTYTITYQTKPKNLSAVQQTTNTNTVDFTTPGGTSISGIKGEVTIGTDWPYIAKTCDTDNGTGSSEVISWTVTVKVPKDYDVSTDAAKQVTETLPEGTTLGIDSIKITKDGVEDTKSTTAQTGFPITLDITAENDKATADQTFVITYTTTLNQVPSANTTYTNTAHFNSKDATATYNYKKTNDAPTANKWINGGEWNSTGVATFGVTMTDASGLSSSTENLKLVDTLPAELEYVPDSAYHCYSGDNWSAANHVAIKPTITENADGTSTLTFDMTSYKDKYLSQSDWNQYQLYYTVRVKDIAGMTYGQTYQLTNRAHWEVTNSGVTKAGDDVEKTYNFNNTGKVITKKGTDIKSGRLEYEIVVNENGLQINGGVNYSLTDTMGTGIDYTMGTLTVDGEKWSGADKATYDANKHVLTIKGLSDGVKHTIKYRCTTNLEEGTKFDYTNAKNDVELTGSDSELFRLSTQMTGEASVAKATVDMDGKAIRIYKYGDGDGANALQGAEFTVYEVGHTTDAAGNVTLGEKKDDTSKKVVTTLSDGYVTASGLKSDTVYLIQETKAPDGYEVADDYSTSKGVYFVFRGTIKGTDAQLGSDQLVWPISDNYVFSAKTNLPTFYVNNTKEDTSKHEVTISKTAVNGTEELEGAKLSIVDNTTDNTVESWVSTNESHKVKLKAGTYRLVETTAPDGYEKAESITFVVTEEGKVTINGEEQEGAKVHMEDAVSNKDVVISKQDIGGNEIGGAQLKVTYISEGNEVIVDSWTSETGKSHTIKVAPGDTEYTLTETQVPDDKVYTIAESISFKVAANGTITITKRNGQDVENTTVDQIVMVDAYKNHEITIRKKGNDNGTVSDLSGATLQIKDADGKIVQVNNSDTFTSDTAGNKIRLQPGTYTLSETNAPSGYKKAEAITFTVKTDGTIVSDALQGTEIVMVDEKEEESEYPVEISKTDITGTNEIAGATLIVSDKTTKKEIETWESKAGVNHTVYLKAGTYILTEYSAPKGYMQAENIEFTVDGSGNVTSTAQDAVSGKKVTMKDAYEGTEVKIAKVDIAGDELAGASLTIYKGTNTSGENNIAKTYKNGAETTENASWSSDGSIHKVTLQPGQYTLVETGAPEGYQIATSITFTLAADGTVSGVTLNGDGAIEMVDDYKTYTVKISKQDVGGTEIAGAKLTVSHTDATGNKVVDETWTSEANTTKEITLAPGEYLLEEVTAPTGYQVATSVKFTVNKDGTVESGAKNADTGKIVMVDKADEPDKHEITISKRDLGGKEIDGATLTLTNAQKVVIAEIETDGKTTHSYQVVAGKYTLTETTTPKGYKTSESVTFEVDDNGTISNVTGGTLVDGVVVMTDAWKGTKYQICKTDITGTNEIKGAKLKLIGTDEAGNKVDSSWTSSAAKHYETLNPGTYTLTEITAPNGYEVAEAITFTVAADGSVSGIDYDDTGKNTKLIMKDEYAKVKVNISKQAVSDSDELPGAKLKVTDADGKEIAAWTSTNQQKTIELDPGTYTLTETTAPEVSGTKYEIAESIVFTVALTNGTVTVTSTTQGAVTDATETTNPIVTMFDKVKTGNWDVNISKTDMTGTKEIAGAKLELTGTETEDEKAVSLEWTTDGVKAHKVSLNAGRYKLTETTQPNGYEKAEDIYFTVDTSGVIQITDKDYQNGENVGRIVMKDEWTDQVVYISKQDVTGAEVKDATLQVTGTDNAGRSYDSGTWKSDGTTQKKLTVKPGTYTLKETARPKGYLLASAIDFTVDANGKITTSSNGKTVVKNIDGSDVTVVAMTDKWDDTEVEISKVQLTNGSKEIDGAVLEITGKTKDGQEVSKRFQTSSMTDTKFKLQPGNYTLTEKTAPDGYVKAEDLSFEVTKEGKVLVNGVEPQANKVTMKDGYAKRKIRISKVDITNSNEIAGAYMSVTCDGVPVDSWTSTTEPHEISYNWDPNATYTLTEINAPNNYEKLVTTVTFTVTLDGKVQLQNADQAATIDGNKTFKVDTDGTLKIANKYAPKPDEPSGGGGDHEDPETPTTEVKIKGSVALVKTSSKTGLGLAGAVYELYTQDGKLVGTYTTDEYGIIQVTGLDLGDYYFVEIQAPEGYQVDSWEQVFKLNKENTNKAPKIVAASNDPIEPDDEEGIGADGDSGMMFDGDGGAISATGDNSLMNIYGVAAAMAAAVLALWVVARRKRHNI